MFEQYAQALAEELPHVTLEGENYPPPYINRLLSNVLFCVRMVLIGLILAGPGALQSLGIQQPPSMYMWAQENKFTAIILLFVIGGQIEGQLLSTGAFEVYLNGTFTYHSQHLLLTHLLPTWDYVYIILLRLTIEHFRSLRFKTASL